MATVSSVISSVKSWVSNSLTKYLPLGGGKMTGTITYAHTGLSIGTNPSATQYKAIHWTDKTGDTGNNNRLATVEYSCNASGTAGIVIGPYQYIANRGSYTGSLLAMNITSDGAKSISWDGKPVVCVTRWTSGTEWYRVYSDGFIEQGGRYVQTNASSATRPTISLHKAFANTNYTLITSPTTKERDGYAFWLGTVTSRTTSNFIIKVDNTNYITDVDWYASGY